MKRKIAYPTLLQYAAVAAAMVLMNFALPQREPLAFPLFYAALVAGGDPLVLGGAYLIASAAALSWQASLSAAIQGGMCAIVWSIYRKLGRKAGYERAVYAACAQVPFLFLFPHMGYDFPLSVLLQKVVLAGGFVMLCMLFEGGLAALLFRAFRARLTAGELTEIACIWLFTGMGLYAALGSEAFFALSLFALLLFAVLFRSAVCVPIAVVLSVPLCVMRLSAVPLAEYAVFSTVALLLAPYGRIPAALSLFALFAGAMFFEGLYSQGALPILFTLLSCLLPTIVVICLPERLLARARRGLLFYRESTLPRIAVNRNRRAVGEQLYEVSSLFREIENSFDTARPEDGGPEKLRKQLQSSLCTGCHRRKLCEAEGMGEQMEKLIAVGKAKGRVDLIDVPTELNHGCVNTAGLLFALNKHLADHHRMALELETARQGRMLLARQAHGVSEILRNIALEQSAELTFSEEEHLLAEAFAKAGILSSEIFLYGEGEHFTATATLENKASGEKIAKIAGEALNIPLALSEKLPLTEDRACFVLKRRPDFDAAFGIASRPKEGELASGDTHSILKIDERRFIVALSDGMGSGEEARKISDRTLTLLESFYKARMPSDTVLSTVNDLLAFSSEERFACLDLAAFDLDSGVADVVKIGSPPGFVLSGETLQVLEGGSLPIGVLEAIRPACLRIEMKEDDFLIFMSDGISTAFGSSAELCAYLSKLHPLNPQSLAEEILRDALRRYRGRAEDDMTVLTVKLAKSA